MSQKLAALIARGEPETLPNTNRPTSSILLPYSSSTASSSTYKDEWWTNKLKLSPATETPFNGNNCQNARIAKTVLIENEKREKRKTRERKKKWKLTKWGKIQLSFGIDLIIINCKIERIKHSILRQTATQNLGYNGENLGYWDKSSKQKKINELSDERAMCCWWCGLRVCHKNGRLLCAARSYIQAPSTRRE